MILLLGGTTESLEIADLLNKYQYPFILTVTTSYGLELARLHTKKVLKLKLTFVGIKQFFQVHKINLVIDATHPFAKIISQNIIQACKLYQVEYIRFERKESPKTAPNLKFVNSLQEACRYLNKTKGKIYLSTGSKTAGIYAKNLGVSRLQIRILPTLEAIKKVREAGFLINQIDGLYGPFSVNLNLALFKRAQAKIVVTKDSGKNGGVQEKIAACKKLKLICLVIKRFKVKYPRQVSSIQEMAHFLGGDK